MKVCLPGSGHEEGRELTLRYEELRREGVQRRMSRELDVFLGEGMCAWMNSWLSLPVEAAGGIERGGGAALNGAQKQERGLSPSGTEFSTGIRSEVVNILASMSLGQLGGDGR
ncbi:MAG: hypothetical protein JRJ66_15910 [Deltaproteobacteria bacterium]|nr:hypothetical protein [Deltaproteobacteria bacterium]